MLPCEQNSPKHLPTSCILSSYSNKQLCTKCGSCLVLSSNWKKSWAAANQNEMQTKKWKTRQGMTGSWQNAFYSDRNRKHSTHLEEYKAKANSVQYRARLCCITLEHSHRACSRDRWTQVALSTLQELWSYPKLKQFLHWKKKKTTIVKAKQLSLNCRFF